MRKAHETEMLILTGIASTVISILVIMLGFWYGNKLQDRAENEMSSAIRIESPESKLLMVAMRCQKMEQDNDMLRLRIEELEDLFAETTNAISTIANKPVEKKIRIYTPLAVDDLVPLTEEK